MEDLVFFFALDQMANKAGTFMQFIRIASLPLRMHKRHYPRRHCHAIDRYLNPGTKRLVTLDNQRGFFLKMRDDYFKGFLEKGAFVPENPSHAFHAHQPSEQARVR